MNEFDKVENYRTLRWMTHVVESNLFTKKEKEDYIDFKSYNSDL